MASACAIEFLLIPCVCVCILILAGAEMAWRMGLGCGSGWDPVRPQRFPGWLCHQALSAGRMRRA